VDYYFLDSFETTMADDDISTGAAPAGLHQTQPTQGIPPLILPRILGAKHGLPMAKKQQHMEQ